MSGSRHLGGMKPNIGGVVAAANYDIEEKQRRNGRARHERAHENAFPVSREPSSMDVFPNDIVFRRRRVPGKDKRLLVCSCLNGAGGPEMRNLKQMANERAREWMKHQYSPVGIAIIPFHTEKGSIDQGVTVTFSGLNTLRNGPVAIAPGDRIRADVLSMAQLRDAGRKRDKGKSGDRVELTVFPADTRTETDMITTAMMEYVNFPKNWKDIMGNTNSLKNFQVNAKNVACAHIMESYLLAIVLGYSMHDKLNGLVTDYADAKAAKATKYVTASDEDRMTGVLASLLGLFAGNQALDTGVTGKDTEKREGTVMRQLILRILFNEGQNPIELDAAFLKDSRDQKYNANTRTINKGTFAGALQQKMRTHFSTFVTSVLDLINTERDFHLGAAVDGAGPYSQFDANIRMGGST